MPDNLRQKTIHSVFWSFLERAGQQGVQFVITIVLARLLLPEEFGLVAMLTIFMLVAQSFIDSGFGSALIQKQDATLLDECSVFYFNILISAFAVLLLCLAAPAISGFYDAPLLTPLTSRNSLHTERWLPCVPYLRLLCIAGLLYPLHAINLNVLKAQGRSDLFLRLEIIKKICVVIAIAITWRWGIIGMLYGQIATTIFCYYLNCFYTAKLLSYPIWEQIRDVASTFVVSVLMGAAVYSLSLASFSSTAFQLLIQVLAGIILYISLSEIAKIPAFLEAKATILARLDFRRPAGIRQ